MLTCRSSSSLELLGSMQYKVSVQATDDSYDKARQNMTEVEKESKKQWYCLSFFIALTFNHFFH